MGDLLSSVTLNDLTTFYNEFYEQFTPGSLLSFNLAFTTNNTSAVTPDMISFAILDNTLGEIPTVDPSLANTFLSIQLNSASPTASTFASDSSTSPPSGGNPISLPAPTDQPSGGPAGVPEPNTLYQLGQALLLLAAGPLARRGIGRRRRL